MHLKESLLTLFAWLLILIHITIIEALQGENKMQWEHAVIEKY